MTILIIWIALIALLVLCNYLFHKTYREAKVGDVPKMGTEIKIMRTIEPEIKLEENAWYAYIHAQANQNFKI